MTTWSTAERVAWFARWCRARQTDRPLPTFERSKRGER